MDGPQKPEVAALEPHLYRRMVAAARARFAYLRWYVDYGCRDDYGAPASATSAWAGVHY